MTTRVFVPEYLFEGLHTSPAILSRQLVELDRNDVIPGLHYWHYLNKQTIADPGLLRTSLEKAYWPEDFFYGGHHYRRGEKVLKEQVRRNTLTPFLSRPHVHINCCSKHGHEDVQALYKQVALEAGRLAGHHGYNLWHGGAASGMMIDIQAGFNKARQQWNYPDHYSVQVISHNFIIGVESKNGSRPTNDKCLPEGGDITIVTRTFSEREDRLQISPVASINLPGGAGSQHDMWKQIAHAKTGHDNGLMIYIVNTNGYYDDVRAQMNKAQQQGMDAPTISRHYTFVPTPAAAFEDLARRLSEEPHKGLEVHLGFNEHANGNGHLRRPVGGVVASANGHGVISPPGVVL